MADNEIVKALECCMGCACKECPYCDDEAEECMGKLIVEALKLINRQKAEIETWKKNCDDLYEEMSERQKAEVEIAKRMGKSKAIKEFAERLKQVYWSKTECDILIRAMVDNLVKEMTGETNHD